MNYWAIPSEKKTHYESMTYSVIFKDRINAIKFYDALCISNENISENCIPAILNYWCRNSYDYKKYLICLYHLTSDYFQGIY